ncbi:hypothetical protein E2C01_063516 [Portunus trituberculatus]|uniref:Uncharacterized protein n=1 Tax=Portunus trituberculatus TaxID=210409 RepID=A0A5B7HJ64_PORTR|nr:hypothetical protein [Portunus trituberculatus]
MSRTFSDLLRSLPEEDKTLVRHIESVKKKINKRECAFAFNLVGLQENILPGYTNSNFARNGAALLKCRTGLQTGQKVV